MKKILSCFLLFTLLTLNVNAVENTQNNHPCTIWNETLWIEGEKTTLQSNNQNPIDLISCNGSVYMPLQNAAQLMNKQINWNVQTWTVSLTNEVASGDSLQNIVLPTDKTIPLFIDGKEQTFVNAKGLSVLTIVYDNTLYVPIRKVANWCNMEIAWKSYKNTQSIYMKTPFKDTQSAEIRNYYTDGIAYSQSLNKVFQQLWIQLYLPGDVSRDIFLIEEKLNSAYSVLNHLSDIQPNMGNFSNTTSTKISQCIKNLLGHISNIKLLLGDNLAYSFAQTGIQPTVDLELGSMLGHFYSIKDAFEEKGYIG